MGRGLTRRHLLQGAAAMLATSQSVAGRQLPRQEAVTDGFRPAEHGFGFRNWSPRSQYFDPPAVVDTTDIGVRVRTEWRDRSRAVLGTDIAQLPTPLIDAIATHLRTSVAQFAGTNGHCYGMVLAAQQYYERPETIPVDRLVASEIEDPTVPIDQPEAPVYEDIVQRQADQFLRFRTWLGRRALVHPDWINTAAVLDDVWSVVDEFDTAALLLFNQSLYGHQVLAYGYIDHGDQIEVPVYDPNRTAVSYHNGPETLWFDRDGGTVTMRPYRIYTDVLFNRYDRIERVPGRGAASPLDHLTVDRATVESSLFPLAVVVVDVEAIDLTVLDPDGVQLERIQGVHVDRSRGEVARMRARYGATPGTYHVSVFGTRSADYEVRAIVSGLDGEIVNATHAAEIATGEVHEYVLDIPASGDGRLARANRGDDRSGLVVTAGAVGGLAAGALGYRVLARRRLKSPVGRSP